MEESAYLNSAVEEKFEKVNREKSLRVQQLLIYQADFAIYINIEVKIFIIAI